MHGLLVLYTTIAALYVYVLVYRPATSYFGEMTTTEKMPDGRVCTVYTSQSYGPRGGIRTRRRRVCRRPWTAPAPAAPAPAPATPAPAPAPSAPAPPPAQPADASPVTSTPTASPPPPATPPPMMTPASAPATTPAPETAPAMNPSANPADGDDEEAVGNNTESDYMAEYPSLF